MEERQFDESQKKHKKTKTILKVAGFISLIAGVVFLLIGLIDFFQSFMNLDMGFPTKIWAFFLAFPLIAIGAALITFGFKKEIARYIKNEAVPIINETGREISPAIENITAAVKKGMSKSGATCECGQVNDKDSKFCKNCGKKLVKSCPNCNANVSGESIFCDKCGTKL